MTDRIKEQLSAFLDGELPDPESALLLKRLERGVRIGARGARVDRGARRGRAGGDEQREDGEERSAGGLHGHGTPYCTSAVKARFM